MQEEIICFCEQYQYPKEAIQTLVNVYDTIELTPSIKELFMEARQNYAQTPFIDYNRYLDCPIHSAMQVWKTSNGNYWNAVRYMVSGEVLFRTGSWDSFS